MRHGVAADLDLELRPLREHLADHVERRERLGLDDRLVGLVLLLLDE
jgi:hypothetical protein